MTDEATTTDAPPIEPTEALGRRVLAAALMGVDEPTAAALREDLDQSRVRSKQGKSYLAVHDVIRTANRIFGFGRWGYEVTDLTFLGQTAKTSSGDQAKVGVYVGYRCTVRLTVAGCLPVSGVGYGDGVEYQEQSPVTSHELAVKEAESDALKRAFRNFGDQFGLILYAKDDEKRRIEQEKADEAEAAKTPEQREAEAKAAEEANQQKRIEHWAKQDPPQRPATPEEVEAVIKLAGDIAKDVKDTTVRAINEHRGKNDGLANSVWLGKLHDALMRKANEPNARQAAEAKFNAPPTSGDEPKEPSTVSGDDVAAAIGS